MNSVDLSVNIAGIKFLNPIMNASGCFDPEAMSRVQGIDLSRVGAIVTKGTTLEPRSGNPQPRIYETHSGMINFIGLENPGIEAFLSVLLPRLAQHGVPIIVNVSGFNPTDYVTIAEKIGENPLVAALEINISCPNVKGGGIVFGSDPIAAHNVVSRVRKVTIKPLIIKLTPNVADIKVIAKAVVDAGANIISLINTVRGLFIDKGKIVKGGLSGPAIKPTALFNVHEVSQTVSVPIIGMGGICTLQDAFDFFKVGASAVAIGTANFSNPLVMMDLITGLERYCLDNGLASLEQVKEKVKEGERK